MNLYDQQAMDIESKRETARLELVQRVAELEAALREIAEEMKGAHDGGCVWPVQQTLRRIGMM